MAEEKPKFAMKSEFSMGQYDFIRYDKILTAMDEVSIRTSLFDAGAMLPLWSILWELFKNFQPIMLDKKSEEFKEKFKELRKKILLELQRSKATEEAEDEITVDQAIVDELDNIQMELLSIKQLIGLGIQIGRTYTPEELIAKGLRG